MRISDWSSDVCSSDLHPHGARGEIHAAPGLIAPLRLEPGAKGERGNAHGRAGGRLDRAPRFHPGIGNPWPTLPFWRPVEPATVDNSRSEGRPLGKRCVRTVTTRWWTYHKKKTK